MADKVKLITVVSGLKPNPDGSHRVALWEPNTDHPPTQAPGDKEGEATGPREAYVAGPTPVQVALTPAVAGGLREGTLVEADSDGDPKDRPSATVREALGDKK